MVTWQVHRLYLLDISFYSARALHCMHNALHPYTLELAWSWQPYSFIFFTPEGGITTSSLDRRHWSPGNSPGEFSIKVPNRMLYRKGVHVLR